MRLSPLLLAVVQGIFAWSQTPAPASAPPVPVQAPARPPALPQEEDPGPVKEGSVLDDEPLGVLRVAPSLQPARSVKAVRTRARGQVAPPPAREQEAPNTPGMNLDLRSQARIWVNRESEATIDLPFPADGHRLSVYEFAQQMPAISPMSGNTFTENQQAIINSLQSKAIEIDGFVRGYRRTISPTGTFAILWVGPAQSSPFSACILVRIPAKRLPPRVNEHFLRSAALRGWPVRVHGFPKHQLQTKYQVGLDRCIPWEIDPAILCEIEAPEDIPVDDSTPAIRTMGGGPRRAWRRVHR